MVSGGNHPPRNPAPASGPGRLSKRTDGGPSQKLMVGPGMDYGDRKALGDQERTAPLSQVAPAPTFSPSPTSGMGGGGSAPQLTPFDAPSARPDEPVTHGVDIGPGGGSGVMPIPPPATRQRGTGAIANMLLQLSAQDTTGDLATLYQAALTRGV